MKPREFDLYLGEDESHVCENDVPWTEGSNWMKPDVHVIDYEAYKIAVGALEKIETFRSTTDIMTINQEIKLFVKEALEKIRAK